MTLSATETPKPPSSRRRRIAVTVCLAALVLAVLGYLAAGLVVYDRLSVATASCGGRFEGNTPAAFDVPDVDTTPYAMPDFEAVTIPSRDPGIQLSAWYIPAETLTGGPAVVLVHGIDSCKREGQLLLAAGMLHRAGISVLLIDLRNHGDSTVVNGRYAGGTREYRDALGGWDWLLAERGFPPERVGLYGQSLGAATALIATGEEPRVAALWEDSSYADLDVAVRAELERNGYPAWLRFGGYLMARLRSGDDLLSLSPIGAAAKLDGRPIAIVHGTDDTRLSVQYASDLAGAVRADGGTVEPWLVDSAEHTKAIVEQTAEYERRLAAFFTTALADQP